MCHTEAARGVAAARSRPRRAEERAEEGGRPRVQALADAAGFPFVELRNAAHAAPVEAPAAWQKAALAFLDGP